MQISSFLTSKEVTLHSAEIPSKNFLVGFELAVSSLVAVERFGADIFLIRLSGVMPSSVAALFLSPPQ